jgi:hypothetical protein
MREEREEAPFTSPPTSLPAQKYYPYGFNFIVPHCQSRYDGTVIKPSSRKDRGNSSGRAPFEITKHTAKETREGFLGRHG